MSSSDPRAARRAPAPGARRRSQPGDRSTGAPRRSSEGGRSSGGSRSRENSPRESFRSPEGGTEGRTGGRRWPVPPPEPERRSTGPEQPVERLQKVLAAAGVGSRRGCEELIAAGRVTVDGRVAELGDKVSPTSAVIYVDGERVVADAGLVYLAMNKPRGVVSTMADERGRAALTDLLGNVPQRVFHVGRLDADSEGLLLLTNDGSLAHRLAHPSFGVAKTYLAEVEGPVRRGVGRELLAGVELDDGPARADSFRVVDSVPGRVLVEVVVHEGRKHFVRRLLAEVGHPVGRLVRTAIGPIKLGDLKPGRTRRLNRGEIAALFRAVEQD